MDATPATTGSIPRHGIGLLDRDRGHAALTHTPESANVLLLQANLGCCADEVILRIMGECSVGVQVASRYVRCRESRVKASAKWHCRCTNNSYCSEWGSRYRDVVMSWQQAGSNPPSGKPLVFARPRSRLRGGTFSLQRVLLLQGGKGRRVERLGGLER